MNGAILLVEDDAIIASGLVYALEQEGYAVTHAQTARAAARAMAAAAYDLAILDMQLPDGTGFDVREKLSNTSVIFLTVVDDEGHVVRAFEGGADDYITKPFRLRNDIHTLVTRRNEEVDALQKERAMLKNTLADISHQIKTPLTSIGIMTDLLENALGAGGLPPEKQAEFAANIRKSLDHTSFLVSALLTMAKLDAGAVTFKRNNVPSEELIRLALEPLQTLLDVKNQRVSVGGEAAHGGIKIYCDRRWTAEALTNIIKNASEHSPAGCELRIELGMNPICAWVSVTDGGDGLTRAEIAGLFKRFQGSRSLTGCGIGLSLARAILRGQNGDIEVDGGGNGVGATFTLKIYDFIAKI
ncbi:MAG: response regulator [Oscillospiraceae bacterium]|jgi:signal transduction histidine kinase|nr:response regulator [Oscillospiraceae bacterium]